MSLQTNLIGLDVDSWSPPTINDSRYAKLLEQGAVLVLPKLPFNLLAHELQYLSPEFSDQKSKNISLQKKNGAMIFKGAQGTPTQLSDLQDMVARYSACTHALVAALFPQYVPYLSGGNTSYRPFSVATRVSSYRKDDTRLHIDSFPSNPTGGVRLLRVFNNINPQGVTRDWLVGEPFKNMATAFLPRTKSLWPGQAKLLHKLGITKNVRTEYDHRMLQLHDTLKADVKYQQHCFKEKAFFQPGTTWIVFSDQVMHAALGGQFMMEQTYYLKPQGLYYPEQSPQAILENLLNKKLI